MSWMIGLRNAPVNAVMTAVNAAPMTIPTARSTTLPRMMKSLKPLSMSTPVCWPRGSTALLPGTGYRQTTLN
jgi:hypothetical protein